MPASKMTFSNCSHRGHGANCHRCAAADKLEALAAKSSGEEAKKQMAEVERLRGPQRKKGERMGSRPVQAPMPPPVDESA